MPYILAIQLGIDPALNKPIPAARCCGKKQHAKQTTNVLHWRAVQRRREILLRESYGYTYGTIAKLVGVTPHYVYEVCRRSGVRRYRTDRYVRPSRKNKAAA